MITYAIAECPLGHVLVAATPRGVCSVTFGDEAAALASELSERFPTAELRRDDAALADAVRAVVAALEDDSAREAVTLDTAGTPFQESVWQELRRIPRGSTVSYGELAERIGRPTASRAVARACATNPVALLTPCHRVVRGDGGPGGYRWGVERKRRLLEAEGVRRSE